MTSHVEIPDAWYTLNEIDPEGASYGDITVTTNYLHLPAGLGRDSLMINPATMAYVGLKVGARYVILSSYDGGTSRPDYGVANLESHTPKVRDMMQKYNRPEYGYAYVAETETKENDPVGFNNERILSVAVNTAELVHQIMMRKNQTLNDPFVWAHYLDHTYVKVLPGVIPNMLTRLEAKRRYIKPGKFVSTRTFER